MTSLFPMKNHTEQVGIDESVRFDIRRFGYTEEDIVTAIDKMDFNGIQGERFLRLPRAKVLLSFYGNVVTVMLLAENVQELGTGRSIAELAEKLGY